MEHDLAPLELAVHAVQTRAVVCKYNIYILTIYDLARYNLRLLLVVAGNDDSINEIFYPVCLVRVAAWRLHTLGSAREEKEA